MLMVSCGGQGYPTVGRGSLEHLVHPQMGYGQPMGATYYRDPLQAIFRYQRPQYPVIPPPPPLPQPLPPTSSSPTVTFLLNPHKIPQNLLTDLWTLRGFYVGRR
jgi:hypothetical protein